MEKLFIRVLCCFVPVRSWRKKIRNFFTARRELREIFFEVKEKKSHLLNDPENVETIFIGSSHADHGIIPSFNDANSFNLGSNSQDLKFSYNVYKFADKFCPNIKKVIVTYSVFSPGFDVAKTYRNYIADILTYHFCLPLNKEQPQSKYHTQFKRWDDIPLNFNSTGNGYLAPLPLKPSKVKERVLTHLRENQRNDLQNNFLKEIFKNTKEKGQLFYVVIMPAREEYRSLLPEKNILFKDLFKVAGEMSFPVIDLWDHIDFHEDDFSDYDHLNIKGAEKLTKIIAKNTSK